MKRLASMKLGFWLLVAASVILFGGAVMANLFEDQTAALNDQLFLSWLGAYASQPHLYLWMLMLFGVLALLGLNTVLCTLNYASRGSINSRRLAVILFHAAFIFFLSGHLLTEVVGTQERVTLESGQSVQVGGLELQIESIDKRYQELEGKRLLRHVSAVLSHAGRDIHIPALRPRFVAGYSLHLSFMDKGLEANQAYLTVKRDYGLYPLLIGMLLALAGLGFYRT